MFCPTCGKKLEKAPVTLGILYVDAEGNPEGILCGCDECDSLWSGKVIDNGGVSLSWVCSYTTHLKLVALAKGNFTLHLHTHPKMEDQLGVPRDHVIIDKSSYIDMLRRLASI